jgi:hypothetical protein
VLKAGVHTWAFLGGILLIHTELSASYAGVPSAGSWVPSLAEIGELESKLQMPGGAAPLKSYTREYAGRLDKGHRIIVGVYSGSSGSILVVKSERDLHIATDGGCGIVEVRYDLTRHRVLDVFCHGEA